MQDTSHLAAIGDRLSRERARLAAARTTKEREFRAVQVSGAEREFAAELRFLGMQTLEDIMVSDDELLAELMA